jgi:hypothetical protein
MKTLVKLLIGVALVNAAWRSGNVALAYYQFKDETEQIVLFGQGQPVEELTRQILSEASKRSLPVDSENVQVMREGGRTVADVKYTQSVELFPSYQYPVNFAFSAEAFGIAGAGSGTRPRVR